MKAGAVVGITAISLAVLAICAGGIMFCCWRWAGTDTMR